MKIEPRRARNLHAKCVKLAQTASDYSDPPTQAEVHTLRDKAEELADDVRARFRSSCTRCGGGGGSRVVLQEALFLPIVALIDSGFESEPRLADG